MTTLSANKKRKQLKILETEEIESLYNRPIFTQEEQILYFSLSSIEKAAMEQLHSTKSCIYFILQLGYFKAKHRFFVFSLQEVENDTRYLRKTYFPSFELTSLSISRNTHKKHCDIILKLCNYKLCDTIKRKNLQTKVQEVSSIYSKPIYIFRELLKYLNQQYIILPSYRSMQDIITKTLFEEQKRLINIADTYLTEVDCNSLKNLLDNPHGLYEITQLKHEPKDFSNQEIIEEINRGEQIKVLYGLTKQLIPHLKISNENIKYYSSLISYYSVFRLSQLNQKLVYIYLLCFIYYRYQKIHDNLISCFIYQVNHYIEQAKNEAKGLIYTYQIQYNENLSKAGQVLQLFTDQYITQDTPFGEVQIKAFEILEPEQINHVANHITKNARIDETSFQWEYIDTMANHFKRRLRPILQAVELDTLLTKDPLLEAVSFLKAIFQKQMPLSKYSQTIFPLKFIPNSEKRYLYGVKDGNEVFFLVNRYEFLVYQHLCSRLEACEVFCRDSTRFRSFEDDLVPKEQWQREKTLLISNTTITTFKLPVKEHLDYLQQLLEEKLAIVNQRIASGENQHIQIKTNNRWTLPYPSADESANTTLN